MLAIAIPRDTVLHHNLGGGYSFTLVTPIDVVPRAFLLESLEVREVSLVPPPPLLTPTRCSDYNKDDDALCHSDWQELMNEASSLKDASDTVIPQSRQSHGRVMPPSTTTANLDLPFDMLASLDENQVVEDALHGLFDDLPFESKTTTDENSEPFQYPWMKNQPADANYTPKKSMGALIDSAESTPEHPYFAKAASPYTWTHMPEMSESFLPKRSLWDFQDLSPPQPPPLVRNNFVAASDVTTAPPMPVLARVHK